MSVAPADEEAETVSKSTRDFETCSHPNCTPTFQDCPGSDSDSHHCVDCGQLWWDDKGTYCSICNDYWCPDWQGEFEYVSDDSDFEEDDGVCPKCWGSKKDMKVKMAKASEERRKKNKLEIKRRLAQMEPEVRKRAKALLSNPPPFML